MIDLENVSKTYAKNQVKALDHLSLHVDSGELFGFIGPNGAGKTTAIKLMTGILRPMKAPSPWPATAWTRTASPPSG